MLTYVDHPKTRYVPEPRRSSHTNVQSTIDHVTKPEDEDLATLRRAIRLVVVSSDSELCILVRSFLQHLGFTVFVCTSVDRAERIFLRNRRIDLWLLDVEELGIEAMHLAFRIRDLYRDAPIVLVSPCTHAEDPLQRVLCQSLMRVEKPLRIGRLVSVIDRALSTLSCEPKVAMDDYSDLPDARSFYDSMD